MKKTTKLFIGVACVALLSSGTTVGAISLVQSVNNRNKQKSEFSEMFQQNPNCTLASYAGAPQPVDLTVAAENSVHAVVHIKSTQNSKTQTVDVQQGSPFDDFFGDIFGFGQRGQGQQKRQVQTPKQEGFGSGVIISKDGYIVTNNHVVADADELTITLNDNRTFKGRIVGTDPSTDLALVKIEGNNFPTVPVGDSDALKIGEWVLAVGNPFNLTSTVTAGIVSAKARTLGVYNGGVESFIQTDAAINQGNSGGALVNARGELVGINAVLSSPTGAYAGYGFAIPTSIMTKVIADLKQYGTVQRALLGIRGGDVTNTNMDDEWKKKMDALGVTEGVYVSEVVEGGSAAAAGLKKEDVIIGINGKKVSKMSQLQETLAKFRPGDKVTVKYIRNKKTEEVTMTLKNEQGNTKVVKDEGMEILGAAFREVPADLKKQLNLTYGIQVSGVSGGKMQEAGIRKGFIILKANGEIMKSVSDLESVMKSATKSPDQVLFLVGMFPSGKRANFAVDLSQE